MVFVLYCFHSSPSACFHPVLLCFVLPALPFSIPLWPLVIPLAFVIRTPPFPYLHPSCSLYFTLLSVHLYPSHLHLLTVSLPSSSTYLCPSHPSIHPSSSPLLFFFYVFCLHVPYSTHGYFIAEEDSVAVIHRHQEEEQERVGINFGSLSWSGCVSGNFVPLSCVLLAREQTPQQEQEEAEGEERR